MKLFSKTFLVMCATSTVALEQPEMYFERRMTRADRKLQTHLIERIGSCEDQIDSCYVKDPPITEWAIMLKGMNPHQDSIFADLVALVESLEDTDIKGIGTISEESTSTLTAKTLDDLQEAFDLMEEAAAVEAESSQISENQVYNVMKTIVGILGGILMNFGLNPMWLTIVGETVDRIIASGGALPSLIVVVQALVTYAAPLIINYLEAVFAPATASRSASLCAEAMKCQYSQMVSQVVPALVGGAFAASAETP